jgi:hypothetical protein
MSSKDQSQGGIDFELRHMARRRIVELLEAHQKSEAQVVQRTSESLLDFYKASLKALGSWVADSYESHSAPYALAHRQSYRHWCNTAQQRRSAYQSQETLKAIYERTQEAVSSIEPFKPLQYVSDKPGMRQAKAERSAAKQAWSTSVAEMNSLTIQLEVQTSELLVELAADVENLPKNLAFSMVIEDSIAKHINKAKVIWDGHRSTELAGLREVIDLTYVLAKNPGGPSEE